MELYTNTHPILISERIASTYDRLTSNMHNQNVSLVEKMYDDIVRPNIGLIIIILIVVIYLGWRYVQMKKKKELFVSRNTDNVSNMSTDGFGGIDDPKSRIARPVFNPSIPITHQTSYVNYLPNQIPVMTDPSTHTMSTKYDEIPNDYAAQNETGSNSIQYTGTYYKNSENGVSDDMYNGFVKQNHDNLMDYNDILGARIS